MCPFRFQEIQRCRPPASSYRVSYATGATPGLIAVAGVGHDRSGGAESEAEDARLGAKRCRPVGSFFGGSCETVGSNYPVEVCKEEERSERSVHFKARLLFGKPKECFASNPVGKTEAGFRNRVKKEMSRSVYVGIAGAAPDCLPRFVGQVSGPRV